MDSPHFIIIPGLAEAQAEESAAREAAFLPVKESICGIDVEGFSPFHFVILDAARSPFMHGGMPTAVDVAVFLWVISPSYNPRSKLARWRFLRSIRGMDFAAAVGQSARLSLMPSPTGRRRLGLCL